VTADEWLAANLAAAPPLSPAQLAILRPIFRPVIPQNTEAAPARQQGPPMPGSTEPHERNMTDAPS
jgi:hypothetical protein